MVNYLLEKVYFHDSKQNDVDNDGLLNIVDGMNNKYQSPILTACSIKHHSIASIVGLLV